MKNMLILSCILAVSMTVPAYAQWEKLQAQRVRTEKSCQLLPPVPRVKFLRSVKSKEDLARLMKRETLRISNGQKKVTYAKFLLEKITDHQSNSKTNASAKKNKKIYFFNTSLFPNHFSFIKSHIPSYAGLTTDKYKTLLFDQNKKVFSAGTLYFDGCARRSGSDRAGVLGFTLTFQDNLLQGRAKGQNQRVLEIRKAYANILRAMPWINKKQLVFVFENQRAYFRDKAALLKIAIPSTFMTRFFSQREDGVLPKTYSTALSYGYLRSISMKDFYKGNFNSQDILILSEVPRSLPPVAGLISTVPQPSYSSIVLRTINQKIPNIFVPPLSHHLSQFKKYLGQLVELEVREGGIYFLRGEDVLGKEVLEGQSSLYFSSQHVTTPSKIKYDLQNQVILLLSENKMTEWPVNAYGARGINFAYMDKAFGKYGKTGREEFKGSFLIPYYYYYQHMTQMLTPAICEEAYTNCSSALCLEFKNRCFNSFKDQEGGDVTLWDFIHRLIQGSKNNSFKQETSHKMALKYIREIIKAAPLDENFLLQLKEIFSRYFPANKRIRFRSSASTEDLFDKGKGGIGFYPSFSICLADEEQAELRKRVTGISRCRTTSEVAKIKKHNLQKSLRERKSYATAIKKIYASLWSEEAFLYRTYYQWDPFDVLMGILVTPALVDELIDGGIIANKNGRTNELKSSVFVQAEDLSEDELGHSEQFQLIRKHDGTPTAGIFDRPIIKKAQQEELMRQAHFAIEEMEKFLFPESSGGKSSTEKILKAPDGEEGRVYNIEFVFSPKGQLIIKQVRPLAIIP